MPSRDTRESARTLAAITFGRLRTRWQDPNTELESIVDLVRLDLPLTFHVSGLRNSVLLGRRERNDWARVATRPAIRPRSCWPA